MQKYIALLRGINVGGNRKILMTDLKNLFQDMGCSNITTYIQSGNVVFECKEQNANELASDISEKIKQKYGFDVPTIVRTATDFVQSLNKNPFLEDAEIEQLHLTFLGENPTKIQLEKANAISYPPDEFQIIGKDVYIKLAAKYSDTKLTNAFFESKLKVPTTTRNWKTVLKLVEIIEAS